VSGRPPTTLLGFAGFVPPVATAAQHHHHHPHHSQRRTRCRARRVLHHSLRRRPGRLDQLWGVTHYLATDLSGLVADLR
jgi:hypothetical protein